MAIYAFKAIDGSGLKHKGLLEADSTRQLRQQLRARGLVPLAIEEAAGRASRLAGAPKGPRPVFSTKALTAFTRELAILLDSGLPLEKSLKLLAMQTPNLRLRERMLSLHAQVVAGSSFAGSLGAYPEDFPPHYRATVTAGEHIGDLGGVLSKLADYGESHLRTLGKVKLAMLYPAILSAFSLLVVTGLMVYVFPDITHTFLQSGHALPWLTVALMAISNGLQHYGLPLLLLAGGAAFTLRRKLSEPAARLALHKQLLKLPLAGKLFLAMDLARFTGTLSMLSSSGVPLADALTIASNVLDNRWLRRAAEQATVRVIEGAALSQSLEQAECFPAAFISMIAGGEASGELDRVLFLAARNQTKELENRVLFGVAILEPMIILALGVMVLLIVLAIMLPILSMNQLVK